MPVKKIDLGPTGTTVADNIRQIRETRHLGYTELSRLLADHGRDIAPLGLRRIEARERRVDVDDLMALAVVFGVSPVALLAPPSRSAQTTVEGTATGERRADVLRKWLRDIDPLEPLGFSTLVEFAQRSWPEWALDELTDRLQELRRATDTKLERRAATKRKTDNGND
jgi:transcriptional regulator with XRE-family HTH domain